MQVRYRKIMVINTCGILCRSRRMSFNQVHILMKWWTI